ncbi:MAG: outer membrane beta-barrel protein [Rhizomicrobium sp.]
MSVLKKLTATAMLAAATISVSGVAAWADAPVNAPDASAPTDQAAGPVVWNMNQEINALAASRTLDPEFVAKGIPLGGGPFRLFTNFVSDASYDDNVYRTNHNSPGAAPQADFFFAESPTLVLDYQTSFVHLDAYADATFNEYAKLSAVDNTEYDAGLGGTYVISRAAQFSGNVSYSQDAQPLSSPDNVSFQARPTLYNDLNATGQFKYQPNRLGFTLGASADVYNYQSQPVIGGGADIDISDRNDTVVRGFFEGDYDFSPGYEGFLRASYDSDQYQHYFDVTGTHRSSTGEQYDVGVKTLLSNLIQGQIYLGYLSDQYDHHQAHPLADISGLDFGASLTWFPTEMLTVHLAGQRSIVDTTLFGASGGDDKNVGLNADYELTRRIHLLFNADYDDTSYNGQVRPSDAYIQTLTLGVGAKWLISHYVQGTLAYNYSTRGSDAPSFVYHDNLVTVGLNFQI